MFKKLIATGVILLTMLQSYPNEAEATIYPTFKNSTSKDVTNTVNVLKSAHGNLPYTVQKMTKTVNIYSKNDAILGSASGDFMNINQYYVKYPINKKLLRDIYYHETSHVIDYKSFTATTSGDNIFNGEQENGAYNYLTGTSYDGSKVPNVGVRSKDIIKVSPSQDYKVTTSYPNDTIMLFYDKNKKVTRYTVPVYSKFFKTNANEEYMSLYTVKAGATLDSFVMKKSTPMTSLSRHSSFYNIYKKANYNPLTFDRDKHEAFATISGAYFSYKSGNKTLAELKASRQDVAIPYMKAVIANKYKVDSNLQSKINYQLSTYYK